MRHRPLLRVFADSGIYMPFVFVFSKPFIIKISILLINLLNRMLPNEDHTMENHYEEIYDSMVNFFLTFLQVRNATDFV